MMLIQEVSARNVNTGMYCRSGHVHNHSLFEDLANGGVRGRAGLGGMFLQLSVGHLGKAEAA